MSEGNVSTVAVASTQVSPLFTGPPSKPARSSNGGGDVELAALASNGLPGSVGTSQERCTLEEYYDQVKNGSDIGLVSVNLSNSIIGAGIIGLPFAIQKAGYVVGVIMMLLMAWVSRLSLGWLLNAGIALRIRSYEDAAFQTLGVRGSQAVLLSQFCESLLRPSRVCTAWQHN